MSKNIQYILVVLLVIVIGLQVTLISRIESIKPSPDKNNQDRERIPTLKEIDERIMHWGQHFGTFFSDSSRISKLDRKMDERLDVLEKKIDDLGRAVK